MTNVSKISEGLNIATQTAAKMVSKKVVFNSPEIPGYRMINIKYADQAGSLLNPKIETLEFTDKNGIKSAYSSKKLENGSRFEVFKFSDEIIKVLKDKFGQIKVLKSTVEEHNSGNPEKMYDNAKEAMSNKTRHFCG